MSRNLLNTMPWDNRRHLVHNSNWRGTKNLTGNGGKMEVNNLFFTPFHHSSTPNFLCSEFYFFLFFSILFYFLHYHKILNWLFFHYCKLVRVIIYPISLKSKTKSQVQKYNKTDESSDLKKNILNSCCHKTDLLPNFLIL